MSAMADRLGRMGRRVKEAAQPRTGAKRTVLGAITLLPMYVKLLYGLLRDRRVPTLDKALVVGAIAYVLLPADLIPDWIPFFGEVDDVFLVTMAVQRLLQSAGRRVVLAHWGGEPDDLAPSQLRGVIGAAAFFLPKRIKHQLRRMTR